jgi:hypothetical protein
MVNEMIQRLLIGILMALLCAACSTVQDQKPKLPSVDELLTQFTEQNGRSCIRTNDIRGFSALDDQLVSVNGRRGEHFLVTTLYRCYSLDSSFAIGFSGSFSEVCGGSAGNQLVTREESCPVKHIYKFPSKDDAMVMVEMVEARRKALAQFPEKL